MAAKKTNGHDPHTDRIVEVLERIEKQAEASNARLERLEDCARATNVRLERLDQTTTDRLQRLEMGLSHLRTGLANLKEEVHGFRIETREELLDLRGEQHEAGEEKAPLEARVAKLEAVVFRPTGT